MEIKKIVHSLLPATDKASIIALKQQHWAYPVASQELWMERNHDAEDIHLLLEQGGRLVAYLFLAPTGVLADRRRIAPVWGIGNVCVDKVYEHRGYGKQIVKKATEHIRQHSGNGLLLCSESNTAFYLKCGWKVLRCRAFVDDRAVEAFVMACCNTFDDARKLALERIF